MLHALHATHLALLWLEHWASLRHLFLYSIYMDNASAESPMIVDSCTIPATFERQGMHVLILLVLATQFMPTSANVDNARLPEKKRSGSNH